MILPHRTVRKSPSAQSCRGCIYRVGHGFRSRFHQGPPLALADPMSQQGKALQPNPAAGLHHHGALPQPFPCLQRREREHRHLPDGAGA